MTDRGTVTYTPSVHFSPIHRHRVRETIESVEPDIVAVELGEDRYGRLRGARETAPRTPLGQLLGAIQASVLRLYGLDPEETDMETAIDTAATHELEVALIDEPISETTAGIAENVGVQTLVRLLERAGEFDPETAEPGLATMTNFEEVRSGDDVQPAVDQLRTLLPEVAEVLLDRRDIAMARRIDAIVRAGHDVVVVIGAAHHNGIMAALERFEEKAPDGEISVPLRRPRPQMVDIPVS